MLRLIDSIHNFWMQHAAVQKNSASSALFLFTAFAVTDKLDFQVGFYEPMNAMMRKKIDSPILAAPLGQLVHVL